MSSGGGNFYNDFEDFEDTNNDDNINDNDDDDDEEEMADDLDVASFRSRMENIMGTQEEEDEDDDEVVYSSPTTSEDDFSSVDELISVATGGDTDAAPPTDWAVPLDVTDDVAAALESGVVLLANPAKFCADFGPATKTGGGVNFFGVPANNNNNDVSSALLAKFGLTLPPPAELGPDRRADLLPVLVLLERHALKGCQALLLNRRTGYLIGDLEQQQGSDGDDDGDTKLWAFMIQPLWFGGTSPGDNGGLDMLHPCGTSSAEDDGTIADSKTLRACEGLYWGGDPAAAQKIMERGDSNSDQEPLKLRVTEDTTRPLSGFDFKFFVQSTRWLPTQLEKEVRDGTWYVAKVSKEVLFKSRDRLGTKRAKPLWTEIMELMGGDYQKVRDELYEDED